MSISHDQALTLTAAYTAAWNTGRAEAVASFFAPKCQIVINRGTPYHNTQGIIDMAAGFFADVPDLTLVCDQIRVAGDHLAYFWTFTGHHATTNNPLKIQGWEEWDLDADHKVTASRGWFDGAEYARQVGSAG